MAVATASIWKANASGNDANGGFFNPGNANMPSDLTATGGTSSAPVVSSGTYDFQAGDVGHWLYTKPTGDWLGGWHQITAVDSGNATLNAAAGAWAKQKAYVRPGSVAGIATVASPTGGVFAVDYSMGTSPIIAVTDAVTDGTTTVTSATGGFHAAMVGNGTYINGGTASLVRLPREIVTVSDTNTIVVDATITAGTGATLNAGGAKATIGYLGVSSVAGNDFWIKAGAYSVTSALTNDSDRCFGAPAGASVTSWTKTNGYETVPGDLGAKPVITLSTNTGNTPVIALGDYSYMENIEVNGGGTLSSGIGGASGSGNKIVFYRCKSGNFGAGGGSDTAKAFFSSGSTGEVSFIECEAYDCNSGSASVASGFQIDTFTTLLGCVSRDHVGTAYGIRIDTPRSVNISYSLIHSGAGIGVRVVSGAGMSLYHSVIANQGSHGVDWAANSGGVVANTLSAMNTGTGFNHADTDPDAIFFFNSAAMGNGTNVGTSLANASGASSIITGSSDPFKDSANDDFTLLGSAGKALQSSGAPETFPGNSTRGRPTIGPNPKGGGGAAAGTPPPSGSYKVIGA